MKFRTLLLATVLIAAGPAFAQAPAAPAAPAAAAPAGDAAAGERVFNSQCRACHQIGPTARNGVGPIMNGIFGRTAGSREGFNYSEAYRSAPTNTKVWTPENFVPYIRNPREVTPGTRMVYAGLRNDQQITDLIAYLASFNPDGSRR